MLWTKLIVETKGLRSAIVSSLMEHSSPRPSGAGGCSNNISLPITFPTLCPRLLRRQLQIWGILLHVRDSFLDKCHLVSVQGLSWRSFETLRDKISSIPSITLAGKDHSSNSPWGLWRDRMRDGWLRPTGRLWASPYWEYPSLLSLDACLSGSLTANSKRACPGQGNPLS